MRPCNRSIFSDEKRLTIAALSYTSPDRFIEQVKPNSAISRWNCSLLCWLPWSERWRTAWGLPRRQTAMTSASVTSCAVMLLLIDHPLPPAPQLIPTPADHDPCAQSRSPRDMMRQGWSVSVFQ